MSEYETKDLSGSMFTNSRKEKQTHPDFNGSIRIEGRDYWLSGWKKQGRSGEWWSLAFKPKDGEAPPFRAKGSSPAPSSKILDGDDIPFNAEFR